MGDYTFNYELYMLGSGDSASDDDYKFGTTDRLLIDALLKQGAETHRHTGASGSTEDLDAPTLTLETEDGSIRAERDVFYRVTLVNSDGLEQGISPVGYVSTPTRVSDPPAPTLESASSGGTLSAGNYFYALSAYTTLNTFESTATNSAYINLASGTSNVITLSLPSLPTGAEGFNVYRRAPGQTQYYYLTSIDMSVATPPTEYDDDGSVAIDSTRTKPFTNNTYSTNKITVTYPGATPSVPDGYTWRIYRSYSNTDWSRSLLADVTDTVSGDVVTEYEDTGEATTEGAPPQSILAVDQPSQVDLEDGNEVQNRLPMGNVTAFPFQITFAHSGTLSAITGEFVWVCEYPAAKIISCRAALGVDSTPASQDVIIDVNRYDSQAATPTLSTIYATQANRPKVEVGEQIGEATVPDFQALVQGDYLTIDIDQDGGGATPTDENLTFTITGLAVFDAASSDDDLWE